MHNEQQILLANIPRNNVLESFFVRIKSFKQQFCMLSSLYDPLEISLVLLYFESHKPSYDLQDQKLCQ